MPLNINICLEDLPELALSASYLGLVKCSNLRLTPNGLAILAIVMFK